MRVYLSAIGAGVSPFDSNLALINRSTSLVTQSAFTTAGGSVGFGSVYGHSDGGAAVAIAARAETQSPAAS